MLKVSLVKQFSLVYAFVAWYKSSTPWPGEIATTRRKGCTQIVYHAIKQNNNDIMIIIMICNIKTKEL